MVKHTAIAVPDVPSDDPACIAAARRFAAISPDLTPHRKRDALNDGRTLDDFARHEDAVKAKLTRAEVAALRLYTGPAFEAINGALRSQDTKPWATTIACCYSGVLKLSQL